MIGEQHEGFSVIQLPVGVYGFTYAPLSEAPLFRRHAYHSFEVQKLRDGSTSLIAFVTPPDAQSIRQWKRDLQVRIYPDAWETATEMVTLDVGHLSTKMNPSRELGYWLSVTVHED